MEENVKKIKVMIAEDHEKMRDLIANDLKLFGKNIEIIGVAENGQVLIDLVGKEVPDIVILDLHMPVLDGYQVLEIFAKKFPEIKTIIYSFDFSQFLVGKVILNGARGLLKKNSDQFTILHAIEQVYATGYFFDDHVSYDILRHILSDKRSGYLINKENYSEIEIKIFKKIAEGKTAEKIGEELNLSTSAINWHKRNLFTKTGGNSKVSLVNFAFTHGILKSENLGS